MIQGQRPWVRSDKGWVAGVCRGLAERFDLNPMGVRALWLVSILFFGFGFLFYFICALCLPVEGHEQSVQEPKFLGVCYRIAKKFDLDVGLLRILTVVIALGSVGTTMIAYVIIHFLIPKSEPKPHLSSNNTL